jgi:hypothetical protein
VYEESIFPDLKKGWTMKDEFACTQCGHVGNPKQMMKGNELLERVLWVLFLVPGLVYTVWRRKTQYPVCACCGNLSIISADSPEGQDFIVNRASTDARLSYRGNAFAVLPR